jgi:ligand-binding sensor domain-containing protein
MNKIILALAIAAGLALFNGSAKARDLDAAITTSGYNGLVSFNSDGSTNTITTSGVTLPSKPTALAFDSTGNLFIGGSSGAIRKMTPDGTVSYFSTNYSGTGSYNGVNGLAFNSSGKLFASITTSLYNGLVSFNSDGSTNLITTSGVTLPLRPTALVFDSTGNLFIGSYGGKIFEMTTDGTVSTFSQSFIGSGTLTGVNGLAFQPQTVPEPSTYALFGLGFLALVVAYRRKVA